MNSDYKREIFYSILSLFITSAFAASSFHVAKGYNNVYLDITEYGIPYLFFSFLWLILLHDTWFYWIHRMMHHPLLYKKIHLIHHKSTNPSPFAAFAFHPLEAIVEALIFPLLPLHYRCIP
jgi:lathosterol oxidase